jgi:CDP-diacylglycerol--glycerol-3-phosphate 3-phosphatidyltransferase
MLSKQQIPTAISLSRVLLVPVIVFFLWPNEFQSNLIAAILFALGSITDYYDGFYARKFNAVSTLGKFIDPIADKILVTSTLICLIPSDRINPLMVILILTRDNLITGLRSVAAADGLVIAAKPAGKWKTALQMVAIPIVILGDPFHTYGQIALWISVVLTWTSAWDYWVDFQKANSSKIKKT